MSLENAIKAIKEKKQTWAKEHPLCSRTPWGAMSLSEISGDRVWLNPEAQSYLRFGWMTEKDLEDWLNGVPGKIILSKEHWEELTYMETYGLHRVSHLLKHFNGYKAEYCLAPGQRFIQDGKTLIGKGFPKKMQKRGQDEYDTLTSSMVKCVEGQIKWMYKDWTRCASRKDLNIWRIPQTLQEEIYGFFHALRLLGLETQSGASNLPEVRENFAWWKDVLKYEAQWDYVCSQGNGFTPWIEHKLTVEDRTK